MVTKVYIPIGLYNFVFCTFIHTYSTYTHMYDYFLLLLEYLLDMSYLWEYIRGEFLAFELLVTKPNVY